MTRAALIPIQAFNPDVEPVKAGFCVVDPATDLFLCNDLKSPHGFIAKPTARYGFCKASGPVQVWKSLAVAMQVAEDFSFKVATVPRRIGTMSVGPLVVWSVAETAS